MGGKILACRWKYEDLDKRCFEWMNNWRTAQTRIITGVQDLYKQPLPTKFYTRKKITTTTHEDYTCRMCAKSQESVAHVLAGCSATAETNYQERHSSVLRILFFEIFFNPVLLSHWLVLFRPTSASLALFGYLSAFSSHCFDSLYLGSVFCLLFCFICI